MVLFNIRNDAEFKGGSVTFADGSTYPFASDHPNYKKLTKLLIAGDGTEEQIFALVAPFDAAFKGLVHLSERVSRKGMVLFFDGDVLSTSIAKAIVTAIDEEGYQDAGSKTWPSYVQFLERLMTNPSEASREHFYKYVESHGLTITPDGYVVLYKGVNAGKKAGEYLSTQAGLGTVQYPDGRVEEFTSAHLPNGVGYVVSIPRSKVDDNRNRHCSNGLHAGTFDYATNVMGTGHLLTVLIDPRDVVSVPSDYNNAKVRVAKYTVLEVNDKKTAYKQGVHEPVKSAPAKPVVKAKVSTTGTSRVAEFEKLIKRLVRADKKINLSRYKNKRITSARRADFAQAAANLGFKA